MFTLHLITIGSLKTSYLVEGCADYLKRLERVCKFSVLELPASKQREAVKQQQEECERILVALNSVQGAIWVLDERGTVQTSVECSTALESLKDKGESLTIVLGGAYGLSDSIRARADRLIALSAMTFPHELCRLVLLEQLYRAFEIQRGSGYHH